MCADEAALTKVIVRLAILVCGIQDKAQRDDLRAGGVVLVSHFSAPGRLSTFVGQCDRNSESDGRIAHGYQSFPHLLEQRPQFRGAMPTCSCSIPSGRFQLFRLQPLCRLVLDASRRICSNITRISAFGATQSFRNASRNPSQYHSLQSIPARSPSFRITCLSEVLASGNIECTHECLRLCEC